MSEIDIGRLQEEFGITQEPVDVEFDFSNAPSSPETILQQNVVKANFVLDRIIREMENGNFSARMAEVASKMVDSITNIASTIGAISNQIVDLQLKMESIKLREKQIDLMSNAKKSSTTFNQQNILIVDRETLLKELKKGDSKEVELLEKYEERGNECNE